MRMPKCLVCLSDECMKSFQPQNKKLYKIGWFCDKYRVKGLTMECKCGKQLNIKMEYIGTPVNKEREYFCHCGAIYKGIPSEGKLEEVSTIVEKELK